MPGGVASHYRAHVADRRLTLSRSIRSLLLAELVSGLWLTLRRAAF
jgi:hypothetical protein